MTCAVYVSAIMSSACQRCEGSCPTRNAVALCGRRQGWAATLAPPARDIRPLEPQIDVVVWERSGAYGSGVLRRSFMARLSRHTRAMSRCRHPGTGSFAGGLGAGSASSGEREGQSPLACAKHEIKRWEGGSARRSPHSHMRITTSSDGSKKTSICVALARRV